MTLSIGKLASLVKKMAVKVIRQRERKAAAETFSEPPRNSAPSIALNPQPAPLPQHAALVLPAAEPTEYIPVCPQYTELFRRSRSFFFIHRTYITSTNEKNSVMQICACHIAFRKVLQKVLPKRFTNVVTNEFSMRDG